MQIPIAALKDIRNGNDYVNADGVRIPNERLTTPADPSVSYAYCSDTMMNKKVAAAVAGVDTIYHEATYDDSMAEKARQRGHSTASQAARIARLAGAKQLIIGHFSKRYKSEDLLLEQARQVFPNTIAANEGLKIDLL